MTDDKQAGMFRKGSVLPIGPTSKIIGCGAVFSIICGFTAWIVDIKTAVPITYAVGEVSIWGCLAGGAAFGCLLGYVWAKNGSGGRKD